MNNREENTDDILRDYINPERIEKAPAGFTSKVMRAVYAEPIPSKHSVRLKNRSLVPVISGTVVLILISAAFLLPGSKSDLLLPSVIEVLKNINISLPVPDFSQALSFNLPVTLIYISIGILVLSLFDRALYGVFHREK